MTWWRDLIERVRLLIFRRREDRELREELQFHIDMETAHRSRAGLDPVEARRRSLLALGGLEQTYAHARDARGTGLIEDFGRDMHFTLRMMRRSPGFTAAAVFMLALGTGANAAIFSVLDAVILHSPFREPDRIVMVHELVPRQTAGIPLSHLERIRVLPIFTAVGSLWSGSAILTGAGDVRHETLECVTAGVFEALGTPTLLGRVLTEVDDRPGSDPVVVVSHRFWRDDLGGDPAVIGRRIGLDGTSATIVGVMPPRFLGPFSRNAAEMWAPLGPALHGSSPVGCRSTMMVNVFARLKPGLLLGSANALAGGSQAVADLPSDRGTKGARLLLVGLDDQTFGELREPFLALLGAVSCVLLIACANVGNLQLERVLGRRHELGLRRALGASRGRVIRQTLTENFVLAVLGAGAGLAAAWWTLPLVVRLIPPYVPHVSDITLRPEVFVAAAAVVLTTMMIVGLIPAIRAASASLMEDLRTGPRSQASAGQWPRRALVVGEVALATTLLVGAALTVQTFLTLRPSDPGFNPAHKIIGGVRRNGPFVADGKNRVFFTRMLQRVRAVPGIQAVSATDYLPMSGMVGTAKADAGEVQKTVWLSRMTSNYLHEMAIPILAGRSFQASDDEHAPAVAIVNERAARALWADGSPIGMSLTLELFDGKRIETQVIGIARNTRSLGVTLDVHNEVYLPYAQDSTPMLHVIATVAGAAPPDLLHAFREAATAEDSGVVIDRIVSFQDIVDGSVSAERFGAWLFGAFGVIAVALAGLGLAAVVTWWVTQRTREIGVRIALGAPRGAVARLILGQSVGLAAAGIALGVVISLLSTRLLRGWLYGVTPLDARTFVLGSAAMLVIAALASYLPARRAAGVDPIVTLRAE